MKIKQPQPFFFEGGSRAVLLLHGFTGNSADVRMLGRFLEKRGYTSLAPHYRGHGVSPEELIQTGPSDWWTDVVAAYEQLQTAGYKEIAVCGLSLGGVFSLKVGMDFPVKGVVPMCAPMTMKTIDVMFQGVLKYAREYKQYEGKESTVIEQELQKIQQHGMPSLADLQSLVLDVREQLPKMDSPLFVVQATNDEIIDPNSANLIYQQSAAQHKVMKWYERSGHVITLGPEKQQLHEDIYDFLESLQWNV